MAGTGITGNQRSWILHRIGDQFSQTFAQKIIEKAADPAAFVLQFQIEKSSPSHTPFTGVCRSMWCFFPLVPT